MLNKDVKEQLQNISLQLYHIDLSLKRLCDALEQKNKADNETRDFLIQSRGGNPISSLQETASELTNLTNLMDGVLNKKKRK